MVWSRNDLQKRQKAWAQTFETVESIGPQLRAGDIIFQTSTSEQSEAIQLATHSPYSHCGILYQNAKGKWLVYEAVQPVRLTPVQEWVRRGLHGRFWVRRLHDAASVLDSSGLRRLQDAGLRYQNRNYDPYFSWSDDRVYCSELIWKMYKRAIGRKLGELQQLRDFDLSHPAVQAKLRERYGGRLPLTETVISPASIFRSPELVTVLSR